MRGGHHHRGAVGVEEVAARDSLVHRLDPRVKIVALIGLVVVSVTTPDGAWYAFAGYGALLLALAVAARLPPGYTLRRMVVEVPFLAAAALLPLVVPDGAVRGATLAAKVTVSVLAMVLLSSTTPFPRLLDGFRRLRAPQLLVLIVGFMWRYLHVIGDEVERMRIARLSRCHQARFLWQIGAIARSVGALFVRSLERGERVHLAMASRGWQGQMPAALHPPVTLTAADAAFAAAVAAVAVAGRLALA